MSNASVAKGPFADQDPNHGMLFFFFFLNLILTFKIHFKSMSKQKELLQPFKLLKN